ncbi:MAG: hypothetical protein VW715_16555, partial [Rhodospirillales bacterium]
PTDALGNHPGYTCSCLSNLGPNAIISQLYLRTRFSRTQYAKHNCFITREIYKLREAYDGIPARLRSRFLENGLV